MSDAPEQPQPIAELPAKAGSQELTIAEACELYAVSDSTVRRGIRDGKIKAEQRATERGPQWVITSAAMEAAGYAKTELSAPERVEVARATLAAEQLERDKAAAELAAALATQRADFLERENARLVAENAEARENLRRALDRIPLALPPAKPSRLRRLFRKQPGNG
jgi:excisionase family DNA binding protein